MNIDKSEATLEGAKGKLFYRVTVAAMVRADARLERELPQIRLPVSILHGTGDKATRASGSQEFYDRASSEDKTHSSLRRCLSRPVERSR